MAFASRREADVYKQLKLLAKAGAIHDLSLQPEFVIWDGGKDRNGKKVRPIVYRADFMYRQNKATVVVDVKGVRTPIYMMKAKMFRVRYPEYTFEEWK